MTATTLAKSININLPSGYIDASNVCRDAERKLNYDKPERNYLSSGGDGKN